MDFSSESSSISTGRLRYIYDWTDLAVEVVAEHEEVHEDHARDLDGQRAEEHAELPLRDQVPPRHAHDQGDLISSDFL